MEQSLEGGAGTRCSPAELGERVTDSIDVFGASWLRILRSWFCRRQGHLLRLGW